MRIIIVGYGEMLKSLALGVLSSKHELVGVLCHDSIGRNIVTSFLSRYLKPSEDFIFIKTHGLNEIKVNSVNSEKFRNIVKELKADVVITGSWSEKFSAQTLNTIPNGFVNVHPSLLPKYRGSNPYVHVLLNREKTTGITFHLMDVNYDTGSILLQKEIPVMPNDTGMTLKQRCCDKAKREVVFLLDNYKERVLNQRSQNEKDATYQSQVSLNETILDFEKENSEQLARRIRALSPWIDCYLPIKNEFYSFEKFEITKDTVRQKAGTIVDKTNTSIFVVTKDLRVMKFTNLRINRPFSKFITKFYWDKCINIHDRVV